MATSAGAGEMDCEELDEGFHCASGDMENRIREQQLDMFADRTSTAVYVLASLDNLKWLDLRANPVADWKYLFS